MRPGPDEFPASRAWCLTARKPFFLRRGAPRRLDETGPEAGRRGASPPANPCFFVKGHHVTGSGQAFGGVGVVLHRPLALVPSSSSTTSDGRIGARGLTAWCFTVRKPLFLRHGAPRYWVRSGFRRGRRGASPPASPCSFVTGHHVGWANRSTGTDGVVLHCPLALVSSSSSTTSDGRIGAWGLTAWCFTVRKPLFLRRGAPRPRFPPSGQFREPAPGSRNSPLPKKRKMSAPVLLMQHLADISPFPLSIGRDCPSLHIRGTVSILSYP